MTTSVPIPATGVQPIGATATPLSTAFYKQNAGALGVATGVSAAFGIAQAVTDVNNRNAIMSLESDNNDPQNSLQIIRYLVANNVLPQTPQGADIYRGPHGLLGNGVGDEHQRRSNPWIWDGAAAICRDLTGQGFSVNTSGRTYPNGVQMTNAEWQHREAAVRANLPAPNPSPAPQ